MKTGNIGSYRPVGENAGQKKTEQKQPQKEFQEVLQQTGGKKQLSSKAKPFSPLSQKPLPSAKSRKESMHSSKPQPSARGEKMNHQSQVHDHKRIEARGERDLSDKEQHLGIHQEQEISLGTPLPVITPAVQTPVEVAAVDKVSRPGLNIDEIQSIVQKVDLAVNEQGLPEFRFELQTEKLGSLDLKVSADNDQIRLEFATEDASAQQILEQNLSELRQMLQDKGLTLAETRFTSRDQDEDRQSGEGRQQNSSYSGNDGKKKEFSL